MHSRDQDHARVQAADKSVPRLRARAHIEWSSSRPRSRVSTRAAPDEHGRQQRDTEPAISGTDRDAPIDDAGSDHALDPILPPSRRRRRRRLDAARARRAPGRHLPQRTARLGLREGACALRGEPEDDRGARRPLLPLGAGLPGPPRPRDLADPRRGRAGARRALHPARPAFAALLHSGTVGDRRRGAESARNGRWSRARATPGCG